MVKVDGGGRLTRRNRKLLKKIISTLADKEIVENKKTVGGDKRKGGDGRDRNLLKGGNRWRDKNLEGGDNR